MLQALCRSDRYFKFLWDLIAEVAALEENGVGNPNPIWVFNGCVKVWA